MSKTTTLEPKEGGKSGWEKKNIKSKEKSVREHSEMKTKFKLKR